MYLFFWNYRVTGILPILLEPLFSNSQNSDMRIANNG